MTESESPASAEECPKPFRMTVISRALEPFETLILDSSGKALGVLPRRAIDPSTEPSLEEHWEERQRKTNRKKRRRAVTSTAESRELPEEEVKPFAIDPFYQRNSVDIAYEVGTAALGLIDSLREFFDCIRVLAHGNGSWPTWFELTGEMITALSSEIPEWLLNQLGTLKGKKLHLEDFKKEINNLSAAQCLPIFDKQIREDFKNEIKDEDKTRPFLVEFVLNRFNWPSDWVSSDWRHEKPFKVFTDCLEKVEEAYRSLGQLFKKVDGWWVADSPSVIDPRHTSIVETLLNEFGGLVSFIEYQPVSKYLGTLCRFLDLIYNPYNFDSFIPPLRCEIATMARRPAPTEDICTKGAKMTARLRSAMSWESRRQLHPRVRNCLDLLENWSSKLETERDEAINAVWQANPHESAAKNSFDNPLCWHKPNWDNQTRTLEYGGKTILSYKLGPGRPATKQWEILQAFQKKNWDDVIEFRLEGNGDTNDTIYQLNTALGDSPIKFHCVHGKGIGWSKTPREALPGINRELSVNTPYAKIEKSS